MFLIHERINRFWSNVDVRGPDDCWLWLCGCSRGYGVFRLSGGCELTHRIAWILDRNKQIPELFDGLPSQICRSCDNRQCCNPRHLFLGNNLINQKDSVGKGRHVGFGRGVAHPHSLLTEDNVGEIERLTEKGDLTFMKYMCKKADKERVMFSRFSINAELIVTALEGLTKDEQMGVALLVEQYLNSLSSVSLGDSGHEVTLRFYLKGDAIEIFGATKG